MLQSLIPRIDRPRGLGTKGLFRPCAGPDEEIRETAIAPGRVPSCPRIDARMHEPAGGRSVQRSGAEKSGSVIKIKI